MPPMDREVGKKRQPDPAVTQERRRKNAELRATRAVTNDVQHAVPACPSASPPPGGDLILVDGDHAGWSGGRRGLAGGGHLAGRCRGSGFACDFPAAGQQRG